MLNRGMQIAGQRHLTTSVYSANVNIMFKLTSQHHLHILPERRG